MRSCSYHAAAAAAAAVAACAAIHISRHRRPGGRQGPNECDSKEKMKSGESLESGGISSNDSGNRDSNSTTRFPWEPARMPNASGSGGGDDDDDGEGGHVPSSNGEAQVLTSRNEMKSTPIHHQQQKDQLDFLASMTFASSSLRQPNCPCCQ